MATHYVDLKVLPDPETSPAQLLGALYDHLHHALVLQHEGNIGISFPGYSPNPRTLGNTLRLHADEAVLQRLFATDWLKGMRDHVRVKDAAATPGEAVHRTVHRKQFKTSVERLRRRRMRRKGETAEQARRAIPASIERRPDLPYVHLHSRSTRQSFCLFIAMGPPQHHPVDGMFDSYGLSKTTTIPWF